MNLNESDMLGEFNITYWPQLKQIEIRVPGRKIYSIVNIMYKKIEPQPATKLQFF